LDKKIEHVTTGIQFALDEASMANKKSIALGFELVKFFRNFSCKQGSQCYKKNGHLNKICKESKTSQSLIKKKDSKKEQDFGCQNQAKIEKSTSNHQNNARMFDNLEHTSSAVKLDMSPRIFYKRGLQGFTREHINQLLEIENPTSHSSQYDLEQDIEENCSFERETFPKDKANCFPNSSKSNECRLHGPFNNDEEDKIPCDTNLDGQLTSKKCREGFVKNYQRTNIHLQAGRIHVNFSHRSRGLNELQKKNDFIVVQS